MKRYERFRREVLNLPNMITIGRLFLIPPVLMLIDKTDPSRPAIQLPDERHGLLFVFRVFDRMSYALILSVKEPVKPGDRFTQP